MRNSTMILPDKKKLEKAAYIFKTIAHPTRLAVIELLDKNGPMNVNELMGVTGCEQSLLSHHLANMKIKGLLKAERNGQNIYYSLREMSLVEVVKCIEKCDCNM